MKMLLLVIYLGVICARLVLGWLNLQHQKRHQESRLPDIFAGQVDQERLNRSLEYSQAKERFGLFEDLFSSGLMLVFIFGGLLPWYDGLVKSNTSGLVSEGLLFFALLILVQTILGLPFSLYRTFVLEARFGFNRTTFKLWCTDLLKSSLVGVVLFVVLGGGALWLVKGFPDSWWLWVWGFWALLSLFLMYIAPFWIEPLFFKFTPLKKESLEQDLRELLARAGLQASKILQVDASRRSGHSNAYFTGIGRVKRVVLFDTLLDQLEDSELLAVLAHELGHWKCGHLRKRLIQAQVVALLSCLVGFWLISHGLLPGLLGLESLTFAAQVILLGWLGSLLGFFWSPCSSYLSRKDERQADQFALQLVDDGNALAGALVRLARENLSNLHPHPLFSAWYYSHPPLLERVAWLQEKAKK